MSDEPRNIDPEIVRAGQRMIREKQNLAKLRELSNNAWDIGMVEGVIKGIALTPTLLPRQKDALKKAQEAIERIGARNHKATVEIANAQNNQAVRPPDSKGDDER